MPSSAYADTQQYLFSLKYHGAKYGIDRIQAFVEALRHPERRYPVIHVAGTNGKGSTCAMLEAIYRASHYRTGLFTSPHLIHLGERVQVNRVPLDPQSITRYVDLLRPVAEATARRDPDLHPSFFEFMTGMAFQCFADQGVDLAIIETGLGGRLDATNVVQPDLTVITSIGFDHCAQLGNTLEAIAREKAGIIKPGIPVVLGLLPPAAEAVIREVASVQSAPVHSVRESFGPDRPRPWPETNLTGHYQQINAAAALLAVELLQGLFTVDCATAEQALHSVDWAGRWQTIPLDRGRRLILDASHNEEGARGLAENLDQLIRQTGQRPVILCGTLGEDRARALMPVVASRASALHLLTPKQPRATPADQLRRFIPEGFAGPILESEVETLFPLPGICAVGEPDQVIVATGSIYLIGEISERWFQPPVPGEGRLQDTI